MLWLDACLTLSYYLNNAALSEIRIKYINFIKQNNLQMLFAR